MEREHKVSLTLLATTSTSWLLLLPRTAPKADDPQGAWFPFLRSILAGSSHGRGENLPQKLGM